MSERIPDDVLLQLLLEHSDFRDFKRHGSSFRNAKNNQCLSQRGFKDFKSDESKSLFLLAKERDFLDEARWRSGMPAFNQQSKGAVESSNFDNSNKAQQIWEKAEIASETARASITRYLTDVRKIPLENYEDLLALGWLRWDALNRCLIYPIIGNIDTKEVRKIQRVFLDESGKKTSKKMLGNEGLISVVPTKANGSQSDLQSTFFVCEGLENALSLRDEQTDTFLLSNGKSNLKHVPAFLPAKAEVRIISDHDANENPNQNGQTEAAKLRSDLISQNYQCIALMPKEPKTDANDALQQGSLDEWLDSLIKVPGLPEVKPKFYFTPINELNFEEPDWLIQGVLEAASLSMIYGESGSGKSFLALDLSACIATGLEWYGHHVQHGGVLYLAGEGRSGLCRRARAWELKTTLEVKSMLQVSSGPVDLSDVRDSLPLVKEAIKNAQSRIDLKLVVVDTLSRHYGGDENVAKDVAKFIAGLDQLKQEFKLAILLIHHSGKDSTKGARGSSAMRAALDTEIRVDRAESDVVIVSNTKQKDAELFQQKAFELSRINLHDKDSRVLVDCYGEPITSCVLAQVELPEPTERPLRKGANQKRFEEFFSREWNRGRKLIPLKEIRDQMELPNNRWQELINSKGFQQKFKVVSDYVELLEGTDANDPDSTISDRPIP